MAVINLVATSIIKNSKTIPLVWTVDRGACEPFFDYDEEGNPTNFGIDDEPPDPNVDDILKMDMSRLLYNVSPSQFAETAIQIPSAGIVAPFSFKGREYLRRIYDTPSKKVLLLAGRQVEKCVEISSICRLYNGAPKLAGDITVGDQVVSMSKDGITMTVGTVSWVSKRHFKECVKITTRQGHETTLALTHPLRTWNSWTLTKDLKVGDKIAAVRHCGIFSEEYSPSKEQIRLATYCISNINPIPPYIFQLSKENTALFLNNLWHIYGHIKKVNKSQYSAEYRFFSKSVIKDIQALLWKFGIPSKIKNRNDLWVLRIKTGECLRIFLDEIKDLKKYENATSPLKKINAQLYTDLYWDRVKKIESMGEQECVDFTVEGTENFVGDGLISHNSTSIGNRMLCYSALINNFRSLYVSPSAEQTKAFSTDRVKDVIENSPLLKAYMTTRIDQAVFFKKFINFSQIRLRYAYLNADRCRGLPADCITIDELQDILIDNIPIIEQSAFHSIHKLFIYSGTPKSEDNTIEHYWQEFSTQNEWVIPCERHGTPKDSSSWHWNILGEHNIGKVGTVCDKCHEPISASHPMAQWASMNPSTAENKDKVTFEGYHIPQLMVSWVDWNEILEAQVHYPRAQFMNEKLGRSYDSGVRPITRAQLQACCKPHIQMGDIENFKQIAQGRQIYCGLDWGCHDKETRILTDRGFVYFEDLISSDKVAQWDPNTHSMTFVTPLATTIKSYTGDLLHFTSQQDDLMVTPDHKMRVLEKTGSWVTELAYQTMLHLDDIDFNNAIEWEGEDKKFINITPNKAVLIEDWLEFLGYFLSFGSLLLPNIGPYITSDFKIRYILLEPKNIPKQSLTYIHSCLSRLGLSYTYHSEFINKIPRFTILITESTPKKYDEWDWLYRFVGTKKTKQIPRKFLNFSRRLLTILFNAITILREDDLEGQFLSTTKKLNLDFIELCIKVGVLCEGCVYYPANNQEPEYWSNSWNRVSSNHVNRTAKYIAYDGPVFCCTVPSGYIVTERNGRVAYQGNSGENTYTVISFGGYLGTGNFTIFWVHRFTGPDLEPDRQLDLISQMISQLQVQIVGVDYGGGFYQNNTLIKRFGPHKIIKYQYNPRQRKKIYWEPNLLRYMCHRSEIMNDIFTALKRKLVDLPNWEEFQSPYGQDILNIFTEYNNRLRMEEYKHSPGKTDDSFHSLVYLLLASMIQHPRPDIIRPTQDSGVPPHHEQLSTSL